MKNKDILIEKYVETSKGYQVHTLIQKADGTFVPFVRQYSKAEFNKEVIESFIKADAEIVKTVREEIANNKKVDKKVQEVVAKTEPTKKEEPKKKKSNFIYKIALAGLALFGTYKLVEGVPNWFKTSENTDQDGNLNVDIITVEEQKKFYSEVTEAVFKESVDNIIEDYASKGFDADYKGVSATLFFANMQSINPEVVNKLIEDGYLESDFVQNMQAFINFDAKVRHINNVYSTDKDAVKFISIAPFAVSNQKDYENILYSEQLLHNISVTDNADEKFKYLMEYKNQISGPELKSNYKHGYDDVTIGYRALNRRFLAPVFDKATTGFVEEEYRSYLNSYSMNVSEIVGFMNKFEGCFENTPKTK